jgi:hypothetical protein
MSSSGRSIASARGCTALNINLRPRRARSCLVPASSKPVLAESISADAFIVVVRTFRPFSVRTNPVARAIVRVGFPALQAPPQTQSTNGFVGLIRALPLLSQGNCGKVQPAAAVLCKSHARSLGA